MFFVWFFVISFYAAPIATLKEEDSTELIVLSANETTTGFSGEKSNGNSPPAKNIGNGQPSNYENKLTVNAFRKVQNFALTCERSIRITASVYLCSCPNPHYGSFARVSNPKRIPTS